MKTYNLVRYSEMLKAESIKTYNLVGYHDSDYKEMKENIDYGHGKWVKFEDHLKEVKRITDKLEALQDIIKEWRLYEGA